MTWGESSLWVLGAAQSGGKSPGPTVCALQCVVCQLTREVNSRKKERLHHGRKVIEIGGAGWSQCIHIQEVDIHVGAPPGTLVNRMVLLTGRAGLPRAVSLIKTLLPKACLLGDSRSHQGDSQDESSHRVAGLHVFPTQAIFSSQQASLSLV